MDQPFSVTPVNGRVALLTRDGCPALVHLNVRAARSQPGRMKVAFVAPVNAEEAFLLGSEFRLESN